MSGFGEQIAVLDGLDGDMESSSIDYDMSDGRIGQAPAMVPYGGARVTGRGPAGVNATARRNVLDASAGANYSGGSSFAPGLPLLPSTVGLAGIPGVLPPKRNVIDPSGGANYSGGSSWAPGMPLTPSSAGLAGASSRLIDGGYGRAGLGASIIDGGYGRAGLGAPMPGADTDLAGAFASVELSRYDENDGRIGQDAASVDQYERMVAPNVLVKTNVIDPSGGANYTGGSSFAPGMPLLPSNAGLAGLDALSDGQLKPGAKNVAAAARARGANVNDAQIMRAAGQKVLNGLKAAILRRRRVMSTMWNALTPAQRAQVQRELQAAGIQLSRVRMLRAAIARAA